MIEKNGDSPLQRMDKAEVNRSINYVYGPVEKNPFQLKRSDYYFLLADQGYETLKRVLYYLYSVDFPTDDHTKQGAD